MYYKYNENCNRVKQINKIVHNYLSTMINFLFLRTCKRRTVRAFGWRLFPNRVAVPKPETSQHDYDALFVLKFLDTIIQLNKRDKRRKSNDFVRF